MSLRPSASSGDSSRRHGAGRRSLLRRRLLASRLMVLVGGAGSVAETVAVAKTVLEGGAPVIQLRLKAMPRDRVLAAARALLPLCEARGALLIVNDDAFTAAAAGAHGVHGGQEDPPPEALRSVLGPHGLVGLSVHNAAEARVAAAGVQHLDYVGVGTVFPSPTKPELSPCGLGVLTETTQHLAGVPAYAIGGVTAENLALCLHNGAHGVAVASAVTATPDPAATTRQFLAQISRFLGEGGSV
ncbi:thiamine phosphate synthase [Planctomycetota bacterium]